MNVVAVCCVVSWWVCECVSVCMCCCSSARHWLADHFQRWSVGRALGVCSVFGFRRLRLFLVVCVCRTVGLSATWLCFCIFDRFFVCRCLVILWGYPTCSQLSPSCASGAGTCGAMCSYSHSPHTRLGSCALRRYDVGFVCGHLTQNAFVNTRQTPLLPTLAQQLQLLTA